MPGEKGENVGVVVHVVPLCNAVGIALNADELLVATAWLNAVMVLLPQLAARTGLTGSLNYCQHFSHSKVAQEIGLVVIWLFAGRPWRDEGVLNHHSYLNVLSYKAGFMINEGNL